MSGLTAQEGLASWGSLSDLVPPPPALFLFRSLCSLATQLHKRPHQHLTSSSWHITCAVQSRCHLQSPPSPLSSVQSDTSTRSWPGLSLWSKALTRLPAFGCPNTQPALPSNFRGLQPCDLYYSFQSPYILLYTPLSTCFALVATGSIYTFISVP